MLNELQTGPTAPHNHLLLSEVSNYHHINFCGNLFASGLHLTEAKKKRLNTDDDGDDGMFVQINI